MDASAHEIEQQITKTRAGTNESLEVLEHRATSGAALAGKIAAIVAAAASIAAVGVVVWRRTHRPTSRERFDRMSPGSVRALTPKGPARIQKPLPSARLTLNERRAEPGMLRSIVREVVLPVVGAAGTALVERVARPAQVARGRSAAPR